ncbi:MAG TPA: filamentous hemagglutinin N-terminal domain-containing protein [Burkholderiales bacterium]|nr:filamentous hemagglutinin N-terminal domain-containing protein [Burkholderiales bacterium]
MITRQAPFALRPVAFCVMAACCELAAANPTGPSVAAGAATFQNAAKTLTVTNTPGTIINWQGFSIGSGETTRFLQQSASSAVLNRVVGQDMSSLLGTLTSNGRVFLVNPHGIVVGAGARIDTAGFIASTLNITDSDFLQGRLRFEGGGGPLRNAGTIQASGDIMLVGPQIENSGIIRSDNGAVLLAAGRKLTITSPDAQGVRFELQAPTDTALNVGTLDARTAASMFAGTLRHSGDIRVGAATDGAGHVTLVAQKDAIVDKGATVTAGGVDGGRVEIASGNLTAVAGRIDAGGTAGAGGSVSVSGPVVIQTGDLHADGASGGAVSVRADRLLQAGAATADGRAGAGGTVTVAADKIIQTESARLSADGNGGAGGMVTVAAGQAAGDGIFSSATASATGTAGGRVAITGNEIILRGAHLDASGDSAGGTVLVGGDWQGRNPDVANAQLTQLNFSTTIAADARQSGDGGKVVVWSDRDTQFFGAISARGGAQGGDGGRIEVSGKENLVFGGMADAGAPNGKPGVLLLDPKNIVIDAAGSGPAARDLVDPNLNPDNNFGAGAVVLANGNIVAPVPTDDFVAADAGAVYLFNGGTGALISTLTGSAASDRVGSGGVTALPVNGNFVVSSPNWNNAAGAATWGSATSGVAGVVSAANSLVGSSPNDLVSAATVGFAGVRALTNGNYVVSSPSWDNAGISDAGAATWGNGTTGVTGAVTALNSLAGTQANDGVGYHGATALTNGNYVVMSPLWNNGATLGAGAATWGDGTTGIVGAVTAANSLVGTSPFDAVGFNQVVVLTNGNYVVLSASWRNGGALRAGAATWGNGTTGVVGAVTAANSLVGTTAEDKVGSGGTALTNGNYTVHSATWTNGAVANAGHVTWGDGTTGVTGAVSAANSLVGTTADDMVGAGTVFALTNGNYVAVSPFWANGAVSQAGAVTWGNGTMGITGAVSAANSLVGSIANDRVGSGGVTALSNGNYVVASPLWDAAVQNVGAATWGNGTTGITGAVSAANSLTGNVLNDEVGLGGVTALTNGNYVVTSPNWNSGMGAATLRNGAAADPGIVSPANSLVGSTPADGLGMTVTALTNGNYVVTNPAWDNGGNADVGASTWGNGASGVTGAISASNSLVGSAAGDSVGDGGVTALPNGNYVVLSASWRNGAVANAGAVTWGNGSTGTTGSVTASNSLVGATSNDFAAAAVRPISANRVLVASPLYDNGADESGRLQIFDGSGESIFSPLTFANNPAGAVTIRPAAITSITNTGTAVELQANNDITLAAGSDIVTTAPGDGGALTMRAGRSITLNSNITTDNATLTLVANETVANGVQGAFRDPGAANITMAPGTTINAGNADVFLTIAPGFGHAATSGAITVASITAANVAVQHNGPTANGKILRADASSMLTGTTSLFLQMGTTGATGSIGTLAEPIRVTTPALEALTPAAAGGIFISGTGDLGIGGVPLSIYGGTVRGVQAGAGGPISIETTGNLTHSPVVLPSSMCGPGSNMGSNPICAVGVGASITLKAATIGSPGGGRLQVQTSGAGVSAESTSGGVFLQQVNGTLNVSDYSLSTPTGQAIELANLNGAIAVDTSMPFATRPVTLVTGSSDTTFGIVTVDASTLTLSGGGAARFDSGTTTINATVTSDKPVGIDGGTAIFSSGGSLNNGVTLSNGGLTVNGATTISNGALSWSNGTIAGTGSLAFGTGGSAALPGNGARILNGPSLTIADMNLGAGSLDVQGGTLTLPGIVSKAPSAALLLSGSGQIDAVGSGLPGLVMTGGTLARSVAGDLGIGGDFSVTGGAIPAGGGELVTQASTTIGGVVFAQRNWRNNGSLNIVPGGRLSPSPGGGFQFTNAAGGTVNLSTNLDAPFGAANEAVVSNQGIMNVAAPGPDAMIVPNAFTNAPGANLNITNGTLDLADARTLAGNMSIPSGRALLVSSGNSAVFDGTAISGTGTVLVRGVDGATPQATFRGVSATNNALTVDINGTVTFDTSPSAFGSVSVSGAGPMPGEFAGSLTANTGVTINGPLDVAGLATFNGTTSVTGDVALRGTLGGSGAFSAPGLNWIGGSIQGAGVKTFTTVSSSDSQSTPHLAGNVALAAGGTWNHNGVMAQDGAGQLAIGAGAVVTNNNLASWNLSSSVGNAISGAGRFDNAGTFANSGATSHSVTAPFVNTGIVNIADGSALTLGPGGPSADTGVISLAGTSSIAFDGDRTLGASSLVSASGGTISVNGGALTVNGPVVTNGPMAFNGGTALFNADAPLTALTPTTMTVDGGTAVFFRPVSIGSTLAISSGRANFNESATVGTTLTLSFGTLGGTGPVGVNGLTTWSGGGMDGSGTTTVDGGLAISGPATKALALDRRVTIPVSTTATWTGSGNIVVSDGSRITNLGEWLDQSAGATIFGGPTGGTFFNQGLYRRAAGDGSASRVGIRFDNETPAASVEVQSGTLRLSGGGTSSRPFSVTGTLDFASGAGGYTVGAGSDITGSGSVVFSAGTTALDGGTYNVASTQVTGGTANFNAGVNVSNIGAVLVQSGTLNLSSGEAIAAPTLTLTGGTLAGTDNVTVSGAMTWLGGTMAGSGSTTAAGTLAIGSASQKNLDGRALNNTGTATWDGVAGSNDRIRTGNGASINNSGTWNDRTGNGAHIANNLGGTMSTFNNTGDYVKSLRAGTTVSESMSIDIPYSVSGGGTTSVQAGSLRLTGGGTSSRPFNVSSGATLEFGDGVYNLEAGSNFTGAGGVLVTVGTANFNGGTYDVTGGTTVTTGGTANFNAGANVVNVGAVTVSGGTLNLSSGETVSASSLALSSGTLAGSDTINVAGVTNWTGGTMTGPGTTTAAGGLTIGGTPVKNLTAGRTLSNTAAATWTGGDIATANGSTIDNSGSWTDQTSAGQIANTGAPSTFNNSGTYTRASAGSGSASTTIASGIAFNNTATLAVDSATLRLGAGTSTGSIGVAGTLEFTSGAYDVNGGTVSGAGTVRAAGGTVNFNGGTYNVSGRTEAAVASSAVFNSGATVNGVGALVVNGGTVTLNSGETVPASALDLSSGTLAGTDTINVAGATTWTGGTMTGAGNTVANGNLTISGDSPKNLDGVRTLTSNATATWSGASGTAGNIRTGNGARIVNNGTWQDQSVSGQISHDLGGAASTFINNGTYVKSGAGTTTVQSGVAFDNAATGQVQVQNGGVLTLAGGGMSAGAFSPAVGGTVEIAGADGYVFGAGTSLNGDGTLRISGRLDVNAAFSTGTRVQLNSGTVNAAADVTLNGVFDVAGGEFNGPGVLTTGAGSTTTLSGAEIASITNTAWNNFGTVTMTGASRFAFGGDGSVPVVINNRSGGVFDVSTSAAVPFSSLTTTANKRFNNEGTLNLNSEAVTTFGVAAANAGTMNVNAGNVGISMAENGGTINIADGATLRPNATFVNAGTIGGTGTFDVDAGTITNNGHLRPGATAGNTIGTLHIAGNLVQGASGAVDLELGGTGAFDVLAVTGGAALAGTVNVTVLPSYTPAIGDSFPVITAAARTGNFATVNKNFGTNMTAAYGAAPDAALQFTIGGGPVNSWISDASGDWSVGGNWSLGHVPTNTETAFIDRPGTLTITIPTGTFTPDALTSQENVTIDGGTLSLANASTINNAFAMNGGTLAGSGLLTVNGPVTVTGASQLSGRLATSALSLPSGSLIVANGGVLNLNGAVVTDLRSGAFSNAGSVNLASGGALTLGNGADGGVYSLPSGSTLEYAAGTRDLDAGIAYTGMGTLRISGGTVNIDTPLTQPSGGVALAMAGGTVNNAAGLALNGAFTWSGGTFTGAGALTTGGATTIDGIATLSGTTWTNFGPIALTGDGRLVLSGSPTTATTIFDNRSSGVITDTSASATPIGFSGMRASTRFDNSGRFVKGAGSNATQTLDVPMTNTSGVNPAAIDVDGGTLVVNGLPTNAGAISVAGGATYSTGGAAFNNDGRVALAAGAAFTTVGNTFTNVGRVDLVESSTVSTGAQPFTNAAGGVVNVNAAGRTDLSATTFNNAGAVNITGGTLALGSGTDSGGYDIASGRVLELAAGTRDLNAGVAYTGTGTLRVAGATVNVNTPLTQPNGGAAFEITSGTLNNANAEGLALNGVFTWSGGTVTGAGPLTTRGTTTIDGIATLSGTTWNNFGPVALTGDGRLVLSGNPTIATTVFDNRSSGVITDTSAAATPIGFAATRASTRFDNSGRFVKAAGSAATQTLDVPMTNTSGTTDAAIVDVQSGTLVANGLSTNAGIINIAGGATFSTAGAPLTNGPRSVLQGNGTLDLGGETFRNDNIVAPGTSPGTLTIAGNYVQGPNGMLEIDLEGPRQGIDYDLLKVNGNATLAGTLLLKPGPAVAPGDSFQPITYASVTGDFAKILPPDVPFSGTPGPTSYTTTRTASTTPAEFARDEVLPERRDPVVFDPYQQRPDKPQGNLREQQDQREARDDRRKVIPECR